MAGSPRARYTYEEADTATLDSRRDPKMIEFPARGLRDQEVEADDDVVDFGDKRRIGRNVVRIHNELFVPTFHVLAAVAPVLLGFAG